MKKGIKALAIIGTVIAGMALILFVVIAVSVNSFRKEYRSSENAIDEILNELQYRKIIAIGESHNRVNEQIFIAENLRALYDAGVRYIFAEGGANPVSLRQLKKNSGKKDWHVFRNCLQKTWLFQWKVYLWLIKRLLCVLRN